MKLRKLLYFIIILAIGIILVLNLGQFKVFIDTIKGANWLILSSLVLVRYLYYAANAQYFVSTFRLFNKNIGYTRALETAVVYNFLNTVIPSGGVSGASYVAREFADDMKASVATAVQLAWYIFTIVGYFLILMAGLVMLIWSNQIAKVSFKIVIVFVVIMIIAFVAAAVLALNYQLAKKVAWKLFSPINWFLAKIKKPIVDKKTLDRFMEDFYSSFRLLLKQKRKLWKPLMYCFLGVLTEIATIYIVFLSLDRVVNPGIVIAGYSLAMFSSLASFFTAGVGVYEAVMSATFVALGESFSTSFAVVMIYRVIAMWLFIPVGLFIYRSKHAK